MEKLVQTQNLSGEKVLNWIVGRKKKREILRTSHEKRDMIKKSEETKK